MRKHNLLFVITKLELGGAQKQLLSLIENLDKRRYNLFLFSAKKGLLVDEALSINKLSFHGSRFLERPVNIFKDLLALIELVSFIKKNKISIVHTHSSKAGILGRLAAGIAKVPAIIHTVHGWSFHEYQAKILNSFYLLLEKICAGFTDKIIVVSSFDKNKGLSNSIGTKGQYITIRYGINSEDFSKKSEENELKKEFGLDKKQSLVGMVACLKPQKSPLDFVNLASGLVKDFPGCKFILVGDGVLSKAVRTLIKKLGLEEKIILAGWRRDVVRVLSALDVLVLTSLWEGLPICVLESMAAGTAVVATDTGGIREAVSDGKNGYLVKAGDVISMKNRVKELLEDLEKRAEFIRASKKIIDSGEFSLSNMVQNTQDLYSGLLLKENNA